MAARIAQLLSRYIGTALVSSGGWLGFTTDNVDQYAQGIALGVAGLIILGVDLAIHKLGTGSVFAPPGTRKV